jgi:acyl-CoA thioester hydrolase
MQRAKPRSRSDFGWFCQKQTQGKDNGIDGYVNNAVHYTRFDSSVSGWLIEEGLLEIDQSGIIGLVVSDSCEHFKELSFPDLVTRGLRKGRIGTTSIA